MSNPGESVRIVDWLASRVPAAPPALAAIIARHVGDGTCSRHDLPSHMIDAAQRVLAGLGEGREFANDLLAADALVSYAIEAAAEDCSNVEALAASAAQRLSSTGQGK